MESQLREYRARKAREKMEEERSKQMGTWTHIWGTRATAESQDTRDMPLEATAQKLTTPTLNSPQEYVPRNYFLRFLAQDDSILTNLTFLKVLLWIVLFVLFLHLEFAAVFVVASFLYIIYSTLGTSRRRAPGELSAYSVFNPNFEQIEGTLTAAQFERELKYGIGSTNK
ncbi:SAYSvFN domain-containing protein 1-like [Acanthaster planci]|uniref:SAYSvFN domain-containing protein 1-like n=1 Tax=Acanthaster planci TaxID=133434 RepID=A0A8B7YFU0_ACAPL|nr:SAYSvFN domain-containing protein 1-like [Acanthaster planci]